MPGLVSHVSQSTAEQSMARPAHQPQKNCLKSAVVSVVYLKFAVYACASRWRAAAGAQGWGEGSGTGSGDG
eukprot:892656-Prymnesium_polylepis.2